MPRVEVERLLGEPDGWDDPSVYYAGDRTNLAGESVGVTLDFYLWYADGRPSIPSDRLERWSLGSGSRWQEGNARLEKMEAPAPAGGRAALGPVAAHYRAHRDYASLRSLVRLLRLGTSRGEVESLLGPPDHCRVEALPCQYRSDRQNAAGLPLGLVVDYRVHNVEGSRTVVTGRLEALIFGPLPD